MRERAKRASASETYIFSGLKILFTSAYIMYIYNHCDINDSIYRQNTDIDKIYVRASGGSELRKCSRFHILKLIFLQYFVGISDTLSVQMTCICFSAYMYRPISKCTDKTPKSIMGGKCPPPAPTPPPHPPSPGYASGKVYRPILESYVGVARAGARYASHHTSNTS